MAAARNVRSTSKFAGNPLTPLVGQDFLDFFGQGESSPKTSKVAATQKAAPKALKEFAPSFVPRAVTQDIFSTQTDTLANTSTRTKVGEVSGFESPNAVAARNQGRNRRDTPVWKQAYDAALIEFNQRADVRKADESKRKKQRDERREREDAPGSGGFARANAGTSLITSAQGFLGGQGGAGSLLK